MAFQLRLIPVLTATLSSLALSMAHAETVRLCVYDLIGTNGDLFNAAKDYGIAIQSTGIQFTLKAYLDERIAVDDFKTGQCDALLATAFRTRDFNPVTAATDSFGAALIIRDGQVDHAAGHEVIRQASQWFNSPQAASLVVQGRYEMAGLIDMGEVYGIVTDRDMNNPQAMAGKRILAFDHDKAQSYLIQKAGAQPVMVDLANFSTQFNHGMADMATVLATAIKPLELDRGMGPNGAICRFPYMLMSYQLIIDRNKFAPQFADASRRYWFTHFDDMVRTIGKAERALPASMWMDLSTDNTQKYAAFLRDTRIDLTEQGIYNKQGLKLLKKIRCKINPGDPECSTSQELQ